MDRSMDGCSEAVSMEPPCIGPVRAVLLRYHEYVTEIRSHSLRYQGTSLSGQRQVPDLGIQVGFSWNDNSKQVWRLSTYRAGGRHHAGYFLGTARR